MKALPAIVGPTASGKTSLALVLARRLNGEIISADSRQVYKHLTIGTSKPSAADLRSIPHHCVDILDPKEEISAGMFGKKARGIVEDILGRAKTPILVGGSGLYVKAVIDGLFDGPSSDASIRRKLQERFVDSGIQGLLKDLQDVDPVSADAMKKEPKVRRIQRALEVYYATGVPLSRHHEEQRREKIVPWIQIGLEWSRQQLYERIDRRVDEMMKSGFLEEVRWLHEHGYDPRLNALNTVGYKELFALLEGRYDGQTAADLIKRNTRRFAKRQLTWFRADKRVHWLHVSGEPSWEVMGEKAEEILEREPGMKLEEDAE